MQLGGVHMPVIALQSATLAQSAPMFWKAVRSLLHTWGCAPAHWICPDEHTGMLQVPVAFTQSAAVAQAAPTSSQPLRFALQR